MRAWTCGPRGNARPSGVRGPCGGVMRDIGLALDRGQSLYEAITAAEPIFPPVFVELVRVAEHTGHLPELFDLAQTFDQQLRLRRQFVSRIVWPLTELSISVVVVGFLIWIMGLIAPKDGQALDILGFGLVGSRGLTVYALGVAAVCGLGYVVYRLVRPGGPWSRPVGRVLWQIPVIGRALQAVALARMSSVLGLTLNSSMEVFQALALGVRSSGDERLVAGLPAVQAAVTAGCSVREALAAGGEYPPELLEMVDVGEQAGSLAESFAKLGRRYQEEAEFRLMLLARAASFLVAAIVAGLIIFVIFRIFHFYLHAISDASKM